MSNIDPDDEFLDAAGAADDDDDFGGEGIDLNFAGVDSIVGFVPVPTGAYCLEITRAKIEQTNDKTGHNVVVSMRITEDDPHTDLQGRSIGQDRWYVPNPKVQNAKKYKTTAGFFKGRLEAVYDDTIPDSFTLNVQELIERQFKGIVMLVDEGWGPQNKVSAYLAASADLSNVVLPDPSQSRRPAASGNNGGATPASGDARGSFRI